MKQLFDTTGKKLITKENYTYVKDYNSKGFIIHKDDFDVFKVESETAFNTDNYSYFNSLFQNNMINTNPGTFWENV